MENQYQKLPNETIAQHALRILEPISEYIWIKDFFTNTICLCCGIGHYMRLTSNDTLDFSENNCNDFKVSELRIESKKFFKQKHCNDSTFDIADVNNGVFIKINEFYPQSTPKQRFIACLKDMIKAGY